MTNEQAAKNFTAQQYHWDAREKNIGEISFLAGLAYATGKIPDESLVPDENGNIEKPVRKIMQDGKETTHVDVLDPEFTDSMHKPEELINDTVVSDEGGGNIRKQTDSGEPADYDANVELQQNMNLAQEKQLETVSKNKATQAKTKVDHAKTKVKAAKSVSK